jgi:hypothetical protein
MEKDIKELVWAVAGKPGSNLEWILEVQDQFNIGELKRDEKGYFVQVRDIVGDRATRIYIPEDALRDKRFTAEIAVANEKYSESQQKVLVKRSRKRSFLKKALIAGSLLGVLYLTASTISKKLSSPSDQKREAITSEINYKWKEFHRRRIAPPDGKFTTWIPEDPREEIIEWEITSDPKFLTEKVDRFREQEHIKYRVKRSDENTERLCIQTRDVRRISKKLGYFASKNEKKFDYILIKNESKNLWNESIWDYSGEAEEFTRLYYLFDSQSGSR